MAPRKSIPGTYVYRMFVKFPYMLLLSSSYTSTCRRNARKHRLHGTAGPTHWLRCRRDPCTLERVAGAQTIISGESGFDTISQGCSARRYCFSFERTQADGGTPSSNHNQILCVHVLVRLSVDLLLLPGIYYSRR